MSANRAPQADPRMVAEQKAEMITWKASLSVPGDRSHAAALAAAHAFDIQAVKERLTERGGYEVVHSTSGIEIGVYVLVAPQPDRQSPHADDEVYIVLEGKGDA